MNATAWIAIAALCVTMLVQVGSLLIWGASMTQRVKQLEADITPLKLVPIQIATIAAELKGVNTALTELSENTRWMRDPAHHQTINPGRGK